MDWSLRCFGWYLFQAVFLWYLYGFLKVLFNGFSENWFTFFKVLSDGFGYIWFGELQVILGPFGAFLKGRFKQN